MGERFKRVVCGTYPGAIPWTIYDDRPAKELADYLLQFSSAEGEGYWVDGEYLEGESRGEG